MEEEVTQLQLVHLVDPVEVVEILVQLGVSQVQLQVQYKDMLAEREQLTVQMVAAVVAVALRQ